MKWNFPLNWLRASVDDIMSRHIGYEKKCVKEGLHFDQNFIKLSSNLSIVARNDTFCQIQMRSWRLDIEVNVFSDQVFFDFQTCFSCV